MRFLTACLYAALSLSVLTYSAASTAAVDGKTKQAQTSSQKAKKPAPAKAKQAAAKPQAPQAQTKTAKSAKTAKAAPAAPAVKPRKITKAQRAATNRRFKAAYVIKNGKRVAAVPQAPVRASRYSLYRPAGSQRLETLRLRALERGTDLEHDPLGLATGAVLAYDVESNKVLYEKNADTPMAIASITKLMTALVIVESKVSLDETFLVTKDDVVASSARSKLRPGMKISRRTALHLALMSSDNRAASFLARTYPGGARVFIRDMNAKAVLLGMTDSVFYDSIGLNNGNMSSAMDLSHLIASAAEYRLIREFSTTPEAAVPVGKRTVVSRTTNRFLLDPDWDIDLQKTGLTTAAGYCLVMQTNIAGRHVAMIFLDAPNKSARNSDVEKLRDWLMSPGSFQTASR
jgi:D-alanyl-D-alanine endopeptidase (penicillin-binding protein 7)